MQYAYNIGIHIYIVIFYGLDRLKYDLRIQEKKMITYRKRKNCDYRVNTINRTQFVFIAHYDYDRRI